jgi:hypothetical protein
MDILHEMAKGMKLLGAGEKCETLPPFKAEPEQRREIMARALAARMDTGAFVRARSLRQDCAPVDDLEAARKRIDHDGFRNFSGRMAPTRVTAEQGREIRSHARAAKTSLADYMRRRSMGEDVPPVEAERRRAAG